MKACRMHGLRMTEQRQIIASVLDATCDHPDGDHPDVVELHRRALQHDPRISLSTVYRTVKLLEQEGIIERHEFMEDFRTDSASRRARYEQSRQHHDHLIDITTGRVMEFHSEEIEALQARIAQDMGYQLVFHRLELYVEPLNTSPHLPRTEP
jgi:Fur family transcriptional regulator, ferric uptake regulator